MNPLFYLVLFVLILGTIGFIYGIGEWIYHRRKHKTILFWSAGLLCLNWYQIPTLIALSGRNVVLTNFNPLLSLALPIAFLGFGLVFLGSLSAISKINRSTIILSFGWFLAALAFYGFYYGGTASFQSNLPVVGSNALFFGPIFLLNLCIAITMRHRIIHPGGLLLETGLWAYVVAACLGLVRCGISIYFGLTYPPGFAALRFFVPSFIVAQAIGLIFLIVSFVLLHNRLEKFSRGVTVAGPEDITT